MSKPNGLNVLPVKILDEVKTAVLKRHNCHEIYALIKTRLGNKFDEKVFTLRMTQKFIKEYKKLNKALVPEIVSSLDNQLDSARETIIKQGRLSADGKRIEWDDKAKAIDILIVLLNKYEANVDLIEKIPFMARTPQQQQDYLGSLDGMKKCAVEIQKVRGEASQDKVDVSLLIQEDVFLIHSVYHKVLKKMFPEQIDIIKEAIMYEMRMIAAKYVMIDGKLYDVDALPNRVYLDAKKEEPNGKQ